MTFFLILVLGGLPWGARYGLTGVAFGVGLILLLFLCVTLHELGHGLAARVFGIPVREIVLLPLGGVALLERNPSKPLHELIIAIAGPLVNVLIAGVLLVITGSGILLGGLDSNTLMDSRAMEPGWGTLLVWLLEANVALVLFNMIPAFPLDGGRVLRALLAMGLGQRRATAAATVVGQIIAVVIGVYGILTGNFIMALVAAFIFFGASQEKAEGRARDVLTTLRVGDAYNKHALTLQVGDRVSKAVDYILTSYQPDFAVMQGAQPIGIVTRDDVLRALSSDPRDLFVTMIMRREITRVESTTSLEEARRIMGEAGVRVVAVYEGDTYLGLVSAEDLAEAFAVLAYQQRQDELKARAATST